VQDTEGRTKSAQQAYIQVTAARLPLEREGRHSDDTEEVAGSGRWAFDRARTPGHYRAISHGKQESSTATEQQQSLQLSGRDSCAPYTFQAGHAGSIPVARTEGNHCAMGHRRGRLACRDLLLTGVSVDQGAR